VAVLVFVGAGGAASADDAAIGGGVGCRFIEAKFEYSTRGDAIGRLLKARHQRVPGLKMDMGLQQFMPHPHSGERDSSMLLPCLWMLLLVLLLPLVLLLLLLCAVACCKLAEERK